MNARPRLRVFAPMLTVIVAIAVVVAVSRGSPAPQAQAAVTSSTAWVLPRLNGGGQVRLSDFHGRPLIVDFFASWCTACRDELPELAAVSHMESGRIYFVGVDSEENGDGLAMARKYGIAAWPLGRDVGGTQQNGLRNAVESVAGMPVIAFYNRSGQLVASRLGAVTSDTLTGLIAQYFGVGLNQ